MVYTILPIIIIIITIIPIMITIIEVARNKLIYINARPALIRDQTILPIFISVIYL